MKSKRLWNNPEIEVVEINGRWFALLGWNGEKYLHCWETNEDTEPVESEAMYEITPIFKGIGEVNEDGSYEKYEIVGYSIL